MSVRFLPALAALFALACVLSPAASVRADAKPAQSLDEALLESLRADTLDEFDRELLAPKEGKTKKPDREGTRQDAAGKDGEDLERQLLRELGPAAVSEEKNPLLGVARWMREVEGLIAQTESGPKTQGLQKEIVANLEELIKKARSQCKKCGSSQCSSKVASRGQVRQPQTKPSPGRAKPSQKLVSEPATKPGVGEAGGLSQSERKELIKAVWGELPEAEREQMLQWAGDQFLEKYRPLIEQYFKRLAEQRGVE
ncbi:MAG: hypothetical protein ABIP48_16085 [Planctomycetota bacterium]